MAIYTQNLILKTFGSMLERMPLEKITVTALIKECNISRNTFYYHYKDIYALLNDAVFTFLSQYKDAVKDDNWQESLKALLYACRDNKRKFYHVYNSLSRDHLDRLIFGRADSFIASYIHRMADPKKVAPERLEVIIDIVTYAVYGFMMRFFWNNMKDDIEENVDKIGAVFEEMLDKLLL